jgi:CelD/BcsL family acetyltransferase involved in cellulose biosynthesis
VAAEFGMRSHRTYHSWIGSYNEKFYNASPGLMLLYKLASDTQDHGIQVIDLGKGPEPYKRSITNSSLRIAEGCIDTRPSAAYLKNLLFQTRLHVLESPLRVPARSFVRGAARVAPPLRNLLWLR